METWDYVIIGAGIAGVSASKELRRLVPQARILLITNEAFLPYKRTSLSKLLHEHVSAEALYLQPSEFWQTSGIEYMCSVEVTHIDSQAHTLSLHNQKSIRWGKLLLATGSEPVLSSSALQKIPTSAETVVFRTWHDMDLLYQKAQTGQHIAVYGMGILGVELADQLLKMGKKVSLCGTNSRIMPRYLSPVASGLVKQAMGNTLAPSSESVDLVVACIGTHASTKLAREAGIECNKGIIVDQNLRTSFADIYAAGDCAEPPDGRISQLWHESEHQGLLAGRNMAGPNQESWHNPGFRMKCEVFDTYIFSLLQPHIDSNFPYQEFQNGKTYLALYGSPDRTEGIIMLNEKEHAPTYQQAVREGWNKEKVLAISGRY